MDGMKEVLMVVTRAMDSTRPTLMYAGTSGGVSQSIDHAEHWAKANNGLIPQEVVPSFRALGVTVILVDPHDSHNVYAATLEGVVKSSDEAASWLRVGQSLPDQMMAAMVLDRADPTVVVVASRKGVHRSQDSGNTWEPRNQGFMSVTIRSLIQSPIHPSLWYAGTNGSGLYRSSNGGESWESLPLQKVKREG